MILMESDTLELLDDDGLKFQLVLKRRIVSLRCVAPGYRQQVNFSWQEINDLRNNRGGIYLEDDGGIIVFLALSPVASYPGCIISGMNDSDNIPDDTACTLDEWNAKVDALLAECVEMQNASH